MNQELNDKIERLAMKYHRDVEGEYGCPGKSCPGVQRLISFGASCAGAAIDIAMQIVRDTPTK